MRRRRLARRRRLLQEQKEFQRVRLGSGLERSDKEQSGAARPTCAPSRLRQEQNQF